jgi:hypothetical protein
MTYQIKILIFKVGCWTTLSIGWLMNRELERSFHVLSTSLRIISLCGFV